MAPRLSGFTRVSSLGPISAFMDRQGGSISRVFKNSGLPLAVLDQPDLIVPLREQFRFLEKAARDTGDPYFGARLGQVVKGKDLSGFGAWVCSADTLQGAIMRSHAGLNAMLQTSTVLSFKRWGQNVRWSIEFVEPESEARHHNEFLGVGYMIDMIRDYAGPKWRPDVIMTVLPRGTPTTTLEDIFGTNISHGHAVSTIEFDTSLLDHRAIGDISHRNCDVRAEPAIPAEGDTVASIATVMDLALQEGYPRIEWVASMLDTSSRTLQRHLKTEGTTFNRLVDDALNRHAKNLLRQTSASITDIALRLGYSDHAHFTRAFRRWTGVAPSTYRRQQL